MKNEPLEVIDLKGNPREIGREYGEACADKVGKMVGYWERVVKNAHPNATRDKMDLVSKQFVVHAIEYAPDLVEQMKGIAEGAKLSFEDIFLTHAAVDLCLQYKTLVAEGCTSFAATGDATKDGETITGQNLDWVEEAERVILRVQPDKGPKYLALAYVGSLGMQGINSAGLAQQSNLLSTPITRMGVPRFPLMLQKVLQQKNLADAIGVLYKCKRASSGNFLLASAEGDIIDVETMPDGLGYLYPERDFITHANHFVTERFKHLDIIADLASDSFLRANRLHRLMAKHYGEITVDLMKKFLADHNGYPDSICRHIDPEDQPPRYIISLAGIICWPREQKMYVTNGQPCENEFIEYKL
jgi:isopenicillin-N N-acyltransferase-like protein